MCKISVIIPIYNVEEYLATCLDSVINQTFKDIEILCVNDCSLDNSLEILEDYVQKDNRIKIINREKNGGLSAARNSGLDVAKGEYIYFIDSDDWIDLDYLEKMYNAVIESKADIILNINLFMCNEDKQREKCTFAPNELAFNKLVDAKPFIGKIMWNSVICLWKKVFLEQHNLRFPEGFVIEDMYFQAISFVWTDKIYFIQESAYNYRIHHKGIMADMNKDSIDKVNKHIVIIREIVKYYKENNLTDYLNFKICVENFRVLYPSVNNIADKYKIKDFFSEVDAIFSNKNNYSDLELFFIKFILCADLEKLDYNKEELFYKLRNRIKNA